MNILNKVGDAILVRFMPKTRAMARCPAETLYRYKCIGSVQYRQTCQVQYDCSVRCGSWVRIGSCPV